MFMTFTNRLSKILFGLNTVPGLEGTMLDLMSCIPYSDGLKVQILCFLVSDWRWKSQ